uniref:Gremlin n=1 Tax=Helobdella sp. Austin TaxID=1071216 RepID=G1EH62_9ANNE|nr:gremlin [Helobdella sp. Austin]
MDTSARTSLAIISVFIYLTTFIFRSNCNTVVTFNSKLAHPTEYNTPLEVDTASHEYSTDDLQGKKYYNDSANNGENFERENVEEYDMISAHERMKSHPFNELSASGNTADIEKSARRQLKSKHKQAERKISDVVKIKPFDILRGGPTNRNRKQQNKRQHQPQLPPKRPQAQKPSKKFPPKNQMKGEMNEKIVMDKKAYLKEDWCKTKRYNLEIKEPGCLAKNIKNNFCYGQCNSFYIPRNPAKTFAYVDQQSNFKTNKTPGREIIYREEEEEDEDDGDTEDDGSMQSKDYFMSCASCVAQSVKWKKVVLNCPRKRPPYVVKKVRVVQRCKCVAVVIN